MASKQSDLLSITEEREIEALWDPGRMRYLVLEESNSQHLRFLPNIQCLHASRWISSWKPAWAAPAAARLEPVYKHIY